MKLYTVCSPSHLPFVAKHFLPSLPRDVTLVMTPMPQECARGHFDDAGWIHMAERKLLMCAQAAKDRDGLVFVCDVDVRFYKREITKDLVESLGQNDVAFQDDGPAGPCSGMFVMRPSQQLAQMFQRAIYHLKAVRNGHDQDAMQRALREYPQLRSALLPMRYWTHGAWHPSRGVLWSPDKPCALNPPADLVVHHGNWAKGVDVKVALLDETLRIVSGVSTKTPDVDALAQPSCANGRDPHKTTSCHVGFQKEIRQQRRCPLPLYYVLQFWEGDKHAAYALARLLADIEPSAVEHDTFVFAPQKGGKHTAVLDAEFDDTLARVKQKFTSCQVVFADVPPDKSYPGVCHDAWTSVSRKLGEAWFAGASRTCNAFFFEPDSFPTRVNWRQRLREAHLETLTHRRLITGPRMRLNDHINGTHLEHVRLTFDYPGFNRCAPAEPWDVFHGHQLVALSHPSNIIANWHGNHYSRQEFLRSGCEAAWVTGCKDGSGQDQARELLVGSDLVG